MNYSQHVNVNMNPSNHWNPLNSTTPLEEPVAFEDFQFSLGLDPEFAMPIPFDISPPPLPSQPENNIFYPMTDLVPSTIINNNNNNNNAVLNEQEQKTFSQFLDQFFIDPNMEIDPQFSMLEEPHIPSNLHRSIQENEEHQRRPSIFPSSLDVQNKQVTQRKPLPPRSYKTLPSNGAIRRGHKELLTEEEKRNNHIASEQKRRSMIRTGFKELTEIVPTLKNVNNSKSTVLFKAVDYINYLEKRNKNLREKIKRLEFRLQAEQHSNSMFQQRQLIELQDKLHLHQKLLKSQQEIENTSKTTNTDSSLIKA
ncbi:uncharacterized protein BX663DRAFT_516493 [Cokeromyces recurvatus]|uniref:uncharacterized protein n=1 Tax=Cokeromyces recurvatus TaxID=90255 RepID=UPI002220FAFD|nr:uncharacterized protein BX663DRAFT_516493 [Cokeromyces recurvatus]KAI7900782.1 hypothetical protein BX663DRAFT_516493 [Cokeromyces recurvatus]